MGLAPLDCIFLFILFTCSYVSSYHGLRSFRINLLQHGLSTGSRTSGNINLPWTGILHMLQCEYLLWCDPLHELQGNTKSIMISSKTHRLQENISYSSWNAWFSFIDLGVFRMLSHTFPLILQVCTIFSFSKVCFHRSATSFPDGLSHVLLWVCWNQQELAVSRKGQPQAFHRDHHCSHPAPIALPPKQNALSCRPDSQVLVSVRHLLHR